MKTKQKKILFYLLKWDNSSTDEVNNWEFPHKLQKARISIHHMGISGDTFWGMSLSLTHTLHRSTEMWKHICVSDVRQAELTVGTTRLTASPKLRSEIAVSPFIVPTWH